MDSWASSACYPRRTFYSLSDGPSTRDHRITMTDFRLCSTCQSRSQAGLCHCTQRAISDRSEPTFARLRYSLGGDPRNVKYHPDGFGCLTAVHYPEPGHFVVGSLTGAVRRPQVNEAFGGRMRA